MNHPNRNRAFVIRLSAPERDALLAALDIAIAELSPRYGTQPLLRLRERIAILAKTAPRDQGP